MPAFAQPAPAPSSSASASGSASTKAPTAIPWSAPRRASFATTYSSSSSTEYGDFDDDDGDAYGFSSEDDELLTPPFPALDAAAAANSAKGKGKGKAASAVDLTASFGSISLAQVAEDDGANPWPQALPDVPSPARLPPPALPLVSLPAPKPATPARAPDPQPPAAQTRPPPQPSPPSQAAAAEDAYRGRSRWPRLLWRSDIDVDSLRVLKNYHERAVGGPLPVLRSGMAKRDVERWSRAMENAGL